MAIKLSSIESGKPVSKHGVRQAKRQKGADISLLKQYFTTKGRLLKDRKKEEFYAEIFLLLQAGLDLKSAIELFSSQESNVKLKAIFTDIENKLIKGSSFSEALEQTGQFSLYEYYSVKIGEESGKLPEVVKELSHYYERKIKLQKQVFGALSYPFIILLTAVVVVIFMMNFIVPLFADAFKRFNSDLPAFTQSVIDISNGLRTYWWLILLVFISIGVTVFFVRQNKKVLRTISFLVIHVPVIGPLLLKIYLARFCQFMSLMTSAKTPLITALDMVGKMVGFLPLEEILVSVRSQIYKGMLLNEALASYSLFDERMVALLKVGEETNNLDVIFRKLHSQYSEDIDHYTQLMSSLLEPLMIVFVGGLVALILVAMYLPMFKIGNTMIG